MHVQIFTIKSREEEKDYDATVQERRIRYETPFSFLALDRQPPYRDFLTLTDWRISSKTLTKSGMKYGKKQLSSLSSRELRSAKEKYAILYIL